MPDYDDRDRNDRLDDAGDRPAKKKSALPVILIILGVIGAVCLGACGFGAYWLYGQAQAVVELADGFLTKVGAGDIAGAYARTSEGFKAKYTQEQFAANMKKARLTEFQSVSWTGNQSNRQNNTGTGELTGTATLKDGTTTSVTIRLAFDGKNWSVDDVTTGGAPTAAGSPTDRPAVPSEADLKKLINRDMAAFHRAVKADDFTAFHAGLSKLFREQKTAAELKDNFHVFVEKGIDLSAVEKVVPTVTKPAAVDGDGVMQVEGQYKSQPANILFKLKYVPQDREWKLLGIDVETKAAD
jgi:FlaG/FlaF family flagellin (archaellin)